MKAAWNSAVDRFLNWILPWECPACGEQCTPQEFCSCGLLFCPAVPEWKFLRSQRGLVLPVQSLWLLTGRARDFFHKLKYEGEWQWLKRWVEPRIDMSAGNVELPPGRVKLVPVPSRSQAWLERGFNPAEELARLLGKKTGCEVDTTVLGRAGNSPQVGNSRAARLKNIRGQFWVRGRVRAGNYTVVLVDDVVTTGATLLECQRVLQDAGIKATTGWTLFRAGSEKADQPVAI